MKKVVNHHAAEVVALAQLCVNIKAVRILGEKERKIEEKSRISLQ